MCSIVMKRGLDDAAHDVPLHLLRREPSQPCFRWLLGLDLVGGEDVDLPRVPKVLRDTLDLWSHVER